MSKTDAFGSSFRIRDANRSGSAHDRQQPRPNYRHPGDPAGRRANVPSPASRRDGQHNLNRTVCGIYRKSSDITLRCRLSPRRHAGIREIHVKNTLAGHSRAPASPQNGKSPRRYDDFLSLSPFRQPNAPPYGEPAGRSTIRRTSSGLRPASRSECRVRERSRLA